MAADEGVRALHVEARLKELGLVLPAPARPVASYVMSTRVGNMIYTGEWLPTQLDLAVATTQDC